jgi:hypothetical protein
VKNAPLIFGHAGGESRRAFLRIRSRHQIIHERVRPPGQPNCCECKHR